MTTRHPGLPSARAAGAVALAVILLPLSGAGCGERGTRVAVDVTGLRAQALLNDVDLEGATIKVDGPGIDPTLIVDVDLASETFAVTVPAGPARHFRLDAWRSDSELVIPAFVGETTVDLVAGTVVELGIAAYPVGLFVGAVQAPDGTALPTFLQVTFTAGWVTPTVGDPVIATAVGGEVRVTLGAGPYAVTASFLDGERTYELADIGPVALQAGEMQARGLYLVQPGTRCSAGFPQELWALAPACRHVSVSVSGLLGSGLVLANAGAELAVPADGTYELPLGVVDGDPYELTVAAGPTAPTQTCVIENGSGIASGQDIVAAVTCTTNRFPVAVAVHGLIGTGLQLTTSAGDVTVDAGDLVQTLTLAPQLDASVVTASVQVQPMAVGVGTPACAIDNGSEIPTPTAAFTLAGAPLTIDVFCVGAVAPLYASAPSWNEYAQAPMPTGDDLDPTLFPCSDIAGEDDACFHGGERRMVEVRDLTTCTGLQARDLLRAFDWECRPFAGGVRLISRQLTKGAHLSTLLDFSRNAWRDEQVEIFDGVRWRPSAVATWWNNPVVEYSGSGIAGPTVSLVKADAGLTISINSIIGAGASVVVQPGVVLTQGTPPLIDVQGSERTWIEGTIAYAVGPEMPIINVAGAPRTVLRNVEVSGGNGNGIAIANASGVLLQDVRAHDNVGSNIRLQNVSGARLTDIEARDSSSSSGIFIVDSSSNHFINIGTYNNAQGGFEIDGDAAFVGSTSNVITNLTAYDNYNGVAVESSASNLNNSNIFEHVRTYRNLGQGIVVGGDNNGFYDVISAANAGAGFSSDMNPSMGTTLVGARVFNNQGNGITLDYVSRALLAELFVFNNAPANVAVAYSSGASFFGITIANAATGVSLMNSDYAHLVDAVLVNLGTPVQLQMCNYFAVDNVAAVGNGAAAFYGDLQSGALAITGVGLRDAMDLCSQDLTGVFCQSVPTGTGTIVAAEGLLAGPMFGDDSVNTTDVAGGAPTDITLLDWISFDNGARGWGLMPMPPTPFPEAGQRGVCTGSDCRIFDFTVRAGSALRNADVPEIWGSFATHTWYVGPSLNEAACQGIAPGSHWVADAIDGRCVTFYLVGAVERMNDNIGNENLLCEVDEDCVQLPNLGGYQGEGAWSLPQSLSVNDGTLAGTINLYTRANAGVPLP